MVRWDLLYGLDPRLRVRSPSDTPYFRYKIQPRVITNPITNVVTTLGVTKASAISSNNSRERYARSVGMSLENPRFGMHIAELVRRFSRPRLSRARFALEVGYPDPLDEYHWAQHVAAMLQTLARLPIFVRGRRLPLRKFNARQCYDVAEVIETEDAPAYYYVGTEGYFEFAKLSRAVMTLFDKNVHISNVHQFEYWSKAVQSYLRDERESYDVRPY